MYNKYGPGLCMSMLTIARSWKMVEDEIWVMNKRHRSKRVYVHSCCTKLCTHWSQCTPPAVFMDYFSSSSFALQPLLTLHRLHFDPGIPHASATSHLCCFIASCVNPIT